MAQICNTSCSVVYKGWHLAGVQSERACKALRQLHFVCLLMRFDQNKPEVVSGIEPKKVCKVSGPWTVQTLSRPAYSECAALISTIKLPTIPLNFHSGFGTYKYQVGNPFCKQASQHMCCKTNCMLPSAMKRHVHYHNMGSAWLQWHQNEHMYITD